MKTINLKWAIAFMLAALALCMCYAIFNRVGRIEEKVVVIEHKVDSLLEVHKDVPPPPFDTSMTDTIVLGACVIASGESTDWEVPRTGVDTGVVFAHVIRTIAHDGTEVKQIVAMVAHGPDVRFELSIEEADGLSYVIKARRRNAPGLAAGLSIGVRKGGLEWRPYLTAQGWSGPGSVIHIEDADDEDPGVPDTGTPVLYAREGRDGAMLFSGFVACEAGSAVEFGPAGSAGDGMDIPIMPVAPARTSAQYQWVSTSVKDPEPTRDDTEYRVYFGSSDLGRRTFTGRD